jgi:hypothetical protein
MSIRAVLMWYIGVLVVIGGSGAAGYTALRQHRALPATQVAALPATQVAAQPTTPTAAQPTTQAATLPTTQVAKPPAAPVAKAAVQVAATAPARHPSPARRPSPAPAASSWADASALMGPLPPLPRALPAHNVSTRHVSHFVVASSHRHGLYAAAHEPSAPRVTYYAYPGYYPYRPAYAYYSYYPRYPYYSAY